MMVEADPGQDMVEGHIDSLQSDRTALQVSRLKQLCKSITAKTKGTQSCIDVTDHQLKFPNANTVLTVLEIIGPQATVEDSDTSKKPINQPVARSSD